MEKRVMIFSVLLLVSLLFYGCSDNKVTGGAVGINDVSTLLITVQMENGTLLYDAEVYVNGDYKGRTNPYGDNPGTKLVVLQEKNNLITVKQGGYIPAVTSINAVRPGQQSITLILEKIKTAFSLKVKGEEGPVEGARVSLYQGKNGSLLLDSVSTDEKGLAEFPKIDDGNYTLKVSKAGYEHLSLEQEIIVSKDGDIITRTVELPKLPELVVEIKEQGGYSLPQAEVSLYTKEGYNSPNAYPLNSQIADSEGQAKFKYLEYDRQYVVVAKKEGYLSGMQEIDLSPENKKIILELAFFE